MIYLSYLFSDKRSYAFTNEYTSLCIEKSILADFTSPWSSLDLAPWKFLVHLTYISFLLFLGFISQSCSIDNLTQTIFASILGWGCHLFMFVCTVSMVILENKTLENSILININIFIWRFISIRYTKYQLGLGDAELFFWVTNFLHKELLGGAATALTVPVGNSYGVTLLRSPLHGAQGGFVLRNEASGPFFLFLRGFAPPGWTNWFQTLSFSL